MLNRRWMITLAGTVLVGGLLPLGVAHAEGPPTTVNFPSTCGQPTLQECIDSVSTGSTVFVDAGTEVDESITIDKSLDLIGVGTPRPSIAFGLQALAQGTGETMRVEHLDFGGQVRARLFDGSGHTIDIRDVRVAPPSGWVGIYAEVQAEGAVSVQNSRVTGYNTQEGGVVAALTQSSGMAGVRLLGNRVSDGGTDAGPGIYLYLGHTGTGNVDVINNSVVDAAECFCGGAAGITTWRNGAGDNDVNVVGNSVSRSATNGVYVRDDNTDGGSLALDLFNNVVSKSAFRGVYLESTDSDRLSVRAGYNAFWKNQQRNIWDGESPGDGNLTADPRFVDEPGGNLRLKAASPLVDAGLSCSPGGVANPDAGGNFRITRGTVDIGAFETESSLSDTPAVVGTDEGDTLDAFDPGSIVCGLGGADIITGSDGPDYLDGGAGADQLSGGKGRDLLFGQGGRDYAYGDAGPDRIYGGDDPDFCLAAKDFIEGNDRVFGGSGNDRYTADAGDDRVSVEVRGCVT
jgi:Ca2+-binding RTX toxin-like protein